MNIKDFPPRGSGIAGRIEMPPSQLWGHPSQLGPYWDYATGKLLLGQWGSRLIGINDDRHIVTIAASRAGKSTTVLIANLLRYSASMLVMDPKGELAMATAEHRRRMGQKVYVHDPFNVTGIKSASYNPFADLVDSAPAMVGADAAVAVDACIINNAKDPHWTDSSKNLSRGIIQHLLKQSGKAPTLRQLRRALSSTPAELEKLFTAMAESPVEAVANVGASFLGKLEGGPRELQSILSTAQEQTQSFDDVAHITDHSDYKLTDLRHGNMTVYLVLPSMRMGTHYRWLRLMVQQALGAMERAPVPRGSLPVYFVLEEFGTLGHLRSIETAAGLMAGYGVKLWSVLQDLTQLQTHYAKSWESFLGNAGVVQCFGNSDLTTSKYISERLGMTQVIERQEVRVSGGAMSHGDTGQRENLRSVRLLDPNEVTQWFARETGLQLLLSPGRPPIYLERLNIERAKP